MTRPAPQVKKSVPEIRLAKLVKQYGGKDRDEAVSQAEAGVESLRDKSILGIEMALEEAEALLRQCTDGSLTSVQLAQIQNLADRVITLAGTFGFKRLDEVARSLGDLTNVLLASGIGPLGPILVHVHVARLFAPKAENLPDEAATKMLAELAKVLEHFGGQQAGQDLARSQSTERTTS